jgi:hypothetical protein
MAPFPTSKISPPSKRPPSSRSLRVYAFDPSFNWQLDTAVINLMTLQVPWEPVGHGPVGEYLEVVDIDPASDCCYAPVDLNHPDLLAMDGLDPAEGDPQFHQQMVYAVAMTTIRNFERALGRRIFWSEAGEDQKYAFVPRLRIYPHALREANAYYSPKKKALLFGYFPASTSDPGHNLPGGTVFACLSHDIIAHETTHALLDGLHRRFIEPSNGDTLALHEAFADVVALFQHFSFPEVLRHQIAKTRGNLNEQNELGALAQQFGQALGSYGALRDALGTIDPETHKWRPKEPDPADIQTTHEAHGRGAILVAAVFDAFLAIYKSRIADLLRIATGGTGVLPQGAIHPDLVDRMAREASVTASHLLNMCIRALDYCPPVDIDFGEYLRALVTADRDLVPDDDRRYRISIIEAFRRRGIYPSGVRSLSAESLCWSGPSAEEMPEFNRLLSGIALEQIQPEWSLTSNRERAWQTARDSASMVHAWLRDQGTSLGRALGLSLGPDAPGSIERHKKTGRPLVEVHSVRPARRIGLNGDSRTDLVIEITQRRHGYIDPEIQARIDASDGKMEPPPHDFWFRGGSTTLIDLETREVRYCIGKSILNEGRLDRQRRFVSGDTDGSLGATYFGDPKVRGDAEPFAMLHRSVDSER